MYNPAIMSDKIAILCAAQNSNYFKLTDKYNLEIYTQVDDCRNFKFDCPVITHAPCAQWSRLHHFAKPNPTEKELAWFCLAAVTKCGGIFEHPSGSHFFRAAHIEKSKIYSVNLSWFGYAAMKRTYLHYNRVSLASHPLSFDAITKKVSQNFNQRTRSLTPIAFNEWLIQSVLQSQIK